VVVEVEEALVAHKTVHLEDLGEEHLEETLFDVEDQVIHLQSLHLKEMMVVIIKLQLMYIQVLAEVVLVVLVQIR
tara:strand:+ start:60 stop:284 length:225 start_codon:yes stop_codon:yes gene_type:complete